MSLASTDPIETVRQRPPLPARATTPNARTLARQPGFPWFHRMLVSAAVWTLYVPHLAILKVLGPRFGSAWARTVGRFHWIFTFVGAQRSAHAILDDIYPQLRVSLAVSTILRKHLELKHECFVRLKVFNRQHGGNRGDDIVWEVDPATAAKFDQLNSSENGLVLIGFHFGFFRLSATALPTVLPGRDAVHVSHRMAHYAGETFDSVAQLALRRTFTADKQSGARIHYVVPDASVIRLYRQLIAGGTVVMAADGAFAKDFLDVPFLRGKLRVPCGWARLAAATQSNVLILLDTEIDHRRRKVWLFDHVQLRGDDSPEAIYGAVAESARILEDFVCREPWSWHPWQRIRREFADDGSQLLVLTELGSGKYDGMLAQRSPRTSINGDDALQAEDAAASEIRPSIMEPVPQQRRRSHGSEQ